MQRLVYIESEPYEKRQEEKDAAYLDEEDMIIRYVKRLVKITVKRNSFYVALGLSRLLHNYTTAETMELYGLLVQDPDRARDDHYYRSRKKVLMQELRERFGRFLKVVRGNRGEERFQSEEPNEKRLGVAEICLKMFTPWNTDCVLSAGFYPVTDYLPQLAFEGGDPDSEHPVEMSRMHTALHPECYARALDSLGFASPDERLEVPNFFLSGSERRPPSDRRHPPSLSQEDMLAIQAELGERASRRRAASAGLLSIMVDGIERARLVPARESRARLDVTEGAELLEVYSKEESGDVLLAAFLLYTDESDLAPERSSIVLEGGQKISFSLQLSKDDEGEITGGTVDVLYEETAFVRAASVSWQRFGNRLAALAASTRWTGFSPVKAALAFAVIAALALGVWFFALSGSEPSKSEVAGGKDAPARTADKEPPAPNPQPANQPDQASISDEKSSGGGERVAEQPPAPLPPEIAANPRRPEVEIPPLEEPGAELTRSVENEPVASSLLGVKLIVIEVVESGPFSESFRQHLIEELRARREFEITDDYNEADALLRVTARQRQTAEGSREERNLYVGQVSVQILNAAGRRLWAAPDSSSQNRYIGESAELARQMVADLLEEIARQERSRKR